MVNRVWENIVRHLKNQAFSRVFVFVFLFALFLFPGTIFGQVVAPSPTSGAVSITATGAVAVTNGSTASYYFSNISTTTVVTNNILYFTGDSTGSNCSTVLNPFCINPST